jgi:hypothetical protein
VRERQADAERAQRFHLSVPVWYRTADETEWHTGTTQNISATGALITSNSQVVPTEPVVIAIELPPLKRCLVGRGRIVRTVETPTETASATFAVAVKRYRIARHNSVLRGVPR